jgi:hypothetical protein
MILVIVKEFRMTDENNFLSDFTDLVVKLWITDALSSENQRVKTKKSV